MTVTRNDLSYITQPLHATTPPPTPTERSSRYQQMKEGCRAMVQEENAEADEEE